MPRARRIVYMANTVKLPTGSYTKFVLAEYISFIQHNTMICCRSQKVKGQETAVHGRLSLTLQRYRCAYLLSYLHLIVFIIAI